MRAIVLALALMASGAAWAETPFPIVDVEQNCTEAVDRAVRRADCIDSEQRAYNFMKANWDKVEERFRGDCTKELKKLLMAYTAMGRCLAQALTVQELNRPREARPFRY